MTSPRPGRNFTTEERAWLSEVVNRFPPMRADQGVRLRAILGPTATWPADTAAA